MRTLGKTSALVAVGALVACSTTHASAFAGGSGATAQVVTTPAEPVPATTQGAPASVATQPGPTPTATQRALPASAPSAASDASARASRRQDIRSMEVLLTQALQTGAQDLARQLKVSEPNSAFVTGTGRARGFILDGHGIFFDVDVPGMRQSVIWSAQMLELEQQRQNMLRFLANSSLDDPRRKMAEANLRQIARLMGAGPDQIVITNPTTNTELVRPGQVTATAVHDSTSSPGPGPGARALAAQAPASPVQPVQQPRDPNELYTDSVKMALIDAMLKYSAFLKIGENEWLTVAASDSDGPQAPGQLEETSRILISIRGSDLAAFQSGKLTREEVLKKVEVKEF